MRLLSSTPDRGWQRWLLLAGATTAFGAVLDLLGAPSAALFASLLTAVVLALAKLAPAGVPRWANSLSQAALGAVIGSMIHADTLRALGSNWLPTVAIGIATLIISIVAGALLGLHRDVDPLTGSLSLIAGGATGLVAIARELGGDDRMVAVIQYLRVAVVVVSMPLIATLVFGAKSGSATVSTGGPSSAWYLGVALLAVVIVPGLLIARFVHVPAGALLIPLTIAAVLELTDLNFGATIPHVVLPIALVLVGWQAGLAFDREAIGSISRALPAATALIIAICAASAGLGVLLSRMTGATLLEGYLATTPGGLSAVLAMSASSGANATFVAGVQLIRMLLMLFLAPLLTRLFVLIGRKRRAAGESRELVATAS